MDSFQSQVSVQSSPEKTGSQTPPPSDSDPMNNSPTYHVIIDIPIELTVLLSAAAAAAAAADVERDLKRLCKMANSFIAVFLTISASIISTISVPKDPDWVFLSAIDPVLAFTSLVCSFGLLFYSLRSHPGADLAKVQVTVMGFSAVLLVLAVLSRLALLFPFQLLLPLAAIVVMLIALLILLLYFTRCKK